MVELCSAAREHSQMAEREGKERKGKGMMALSHQRSCGARPGGPTRLNLVGSFPRDPHDLG
jgi:hypothetical protein